MNAVYLAEQVRGGEYVFVKKENSALNRPMKMKSAQHHYAEEQQSVGIYLSAFSNQQI